MSFPDPQHGMLVVAERGARPIPTAAEVAVTSDGGAHWTLVSQMAPAGPVMFTDPLHGYITPMNGAPLQVTTDGGRRWTVAGVTGPADAAGVAAPSSLPSRQPDGTLTVASPTSKTTAGFFGSVDGVHWKLSGEWTAPTGGQVFQVGTTPDGTRWVQYGSPSTGASSFALDTGHGWSSTSLPSALYNGQFTATARMIWASIGLTDSSDDHQRLAASGDGGHTWTLIVAPTH